MALSTIDPYEFYIPVNAYRVDVFEEEFFMLLRNNIGTMSGDEYNVIKKSYMAHGFVFKVYTLQR